MHVELDRLRRELRQKMFVGSPGGETYVTAKPEERIQRLREASRPSDEPRPPKRSVQSELPGT
jgi:hypothetical protein